MLKMIIIFGIRARILRILVCSCYSILTRIMILIHGHNTEKVTESADKDPEDTVTDTNTDTWTKY